jgi:hypothetical protein
MRRRVRENPSTAFVVGGLALGLLAVGAVAYAAGKKTVTPTPGALPIAPGQPGGGGTAAEQNTLTPATTLTQNVFYELMSSVPQGIADVPSLISALKSAQWTNVQIIYFGPTGSGIYPSNFPGAPSTPTPTTYVASAQWAGNNGTAVPAGVLVANVATAFTLAPGAQSVSIPSGGMLNLYLPTGARWTQLVDSSDTTKSVGGVVMGQTGPATVQFTSTGGILGLFQTTSGSLIATWVDSTGATQTTTLNYKTT